jgi:hypothetical protein
MVRDALILITTPMNTLLRFGAVVFVLVLVTSVPAADAGKAGPITDRVGFPRDYRTKFQVIRRTNVPNKNQVGTIYANDRAASLTDLAKLPYPNGSVIVFEWADSVKAADGTPQTGADGIWRKGEVTRIDVMRREANYGALYGEERATDWEFASYFFDGRPMKLGAETLECAKCHRKAMERDAVFRGRFPELPKK